MFFELPSVPIYCNLLWPDSESARNCPRGDIRLAACRRCGFITNVAFQPERMNYTRGYENSLHFSSRFQDYARDLAGRLVARCEGAGKTIVEIGCGQGDFLRLLCRLGGHRGIGFDPSYEPRPEGESGEDDITIVPDVYSERYARQADLVCCRQVLEHLHDPRRLLATVRNAGARENTLVFFEVPNGLHTFKNLAIWDIIYEHCSYFTPPSLAHLFRASGYQVEEMTEEFGGQFLAIVARPQGDVNSPRPPEQEFGRLWQLLTSFAHRFHEEAAEWNRWFGSPEQRERRIAVWGAGSKGVTFLNVLGLGHRIGQVVDLNPRKQGMYVGGTGHQIVAPESLREHPPDVVLVMNPIYEAEVRSAVRSLGLSPDVVCV